MGQDETTQLDLNYFAFRSKLPELLQTHAGKYALLYQQHIVSYFDSALDALKVGHSQYGEGEYSVQEITGEIENLGFYSYAGAALQA
jgi:hypothetical protein